MTENQQKTKHFIVFRLFLFMYFPLHMIAICMRQIWIALEHIPWHEKSLEPGVSWHLSNQCSWIICIQFEIQAFTQPEIHWNEIWGRDATKTRNTLCTQKVLSVQEILSEIQLCHKTIYFREF